MNRQIILASRPSGLPTNQNFDLIEVDERAPRNGEVLCKTIYLSLDPYMRGRMNEAKSYAKPVTLGTMHRTKSANLGNVKPVRRNNQFCFRLQFEQLQLLWSFPYVQKNVIRIQYGLQLM